MSHDPPPKRATPSTRSVVDVTATHAHSSPVRDWSGLLPAAGPSLHQLRPPGSTRYSASFLGCRPPRSPILALGRRSRPRCSYRGMQGKHGLDIVLDYLQGLKAQLSSLPAAMPPSRLVGVGLAMHAGFPIVYERG